MELAKHRGKFVKCALIKEDIYNTVLWFFWDMSYSEMEKLGLAIEAFTGIPDYPSDIAIAGCVLPFEDDIHALWIRDRSMNTLAHEASHLIDLKLKCRRVGDHSETSEARAYYAGWLHEELWNAVQRHEELERKRLCKKKPKTNPQKHTTQAKNA